MHQRQHAAPAKPHAGLTGKALELALEGFPLRMQVQMARQAKLTLAASNHQSKEATMASSTRKRITAAPAPMKTRKRGSDAKRQEASSKQRASRTEASRKLTPAHVASIAKCTPFEVRKYLRSQKAIKRSTDGWLLTDKQAASVAKAIKA